MRAQPILRLCITSLYCLSRIAVGDDSTSADLPLRIDAQLQQQVDDYVTPMVDAGLFAGSVLMSRDGHVVVRNSYGLADRDSGEENTPQTKFKLMSTSKTFTAVAVMTLIESEKLSMDDSVGEFLHACPPAWKSVTVRQLLSHTSNVPNVAMAWGNSTEVVGDVGMGNWKAFAPRQHDSTLTEFPQNRSIYSNFNYVLLGLIIESVSGQSYEDYVRQNVLQRAGLKQTGFANGEGRPGLAVGYFRGPNGSVTISRQNMSRIQAAGGLYSTVDDLFRYDRALADDRLLSPKTRELMFTPITNRFGGGWEVLPRAGRRCVSHSGGANGYVADFLRFPDEDACVAVQSNLAFAPISLISRDLTAVLFGEDYETVQVPSESTLSRASGLYREVDGDSFVLVRRSGKTLIGFDLDLDAEQNFGRLLIPYAGEKFVQPIGGDVLTFDDSFPERSRLTLRTFRTTREFERLPPADDWELTGEYDLDGYRVHVVRQGDRFVMNGPAASLQRGELVPVSQDLALALRMEMQAEFLKLHRDGDANLTGFTWRPIGGQPREAARID